MNSWFGKVLFLTVVISLAMILVTKFSPPFPISSTVTQKTDLFTVSGEGKVTVIPDTGIVSLGVNLTRPTVKSAQNEVNTIINKITAETKKLGVDSKDIKTSNYSVYPNYDYQSGSNRITGYQVSTTINIRVRDLEKINQVIDSATGNGANTVNGIDLTVDEDRQKALLQQARELAVKEAKTKAESLSKAAGLTLGSIVNVQESGGYTPRPIYTFSKVAEAGMGGNTDTQINPGSTDITTSVTLMYETR